MARSRIASFLLLTLPGVPFVYYGEEIGMTGAKPDERLRTPMQWSAAPGAGFTRGRPWQQLQDDSLTTTVAAQEGDPASILELHRRLIPLRDGNVALAAGLLVPLTASNDAVAAYLRIDGNQIVMVLANIGATALSGVSVSSDGGALPRGAWTVRSLLGGGEGAAVQIGDDGRVDGYVPLPTLAPLEGYIFEFTPRR